MPDPNQLLALHARAARRFDEIVDRIHEDAWGDPTPCADWSVRDLVDHMIEEARWAPHILHGLDLEQAGRRVEHETGGDPREAFHRANAGEVAAAVPPVFERQVHTSEGEISAQAYLLQRLCDLIVHAWDLAIAIGVEPDLDAEAVEVCYEASKPNEGQMKESGLFGDLIQPDPDSDPVTRLLALFGRTPT